MTIAPGTAGPKGRPTDPTVIEVRQRRTRAMLTTLLASFGAPLLVAGDEMGRTQRGNNNAYCQDNEISWVDWSDVDTALVAFTKQAIAFRNHHPVLRRRRFLTGAETVEIEWFTPGGAAMTPQDWGDPNARCVAVYLDGSDDPDRDHEGLLLVDDDLLLLVNGWSQPIDFVIPDVRPGARWSVGLDTADLTGSGVGAEVGSSGAKIAVQGRSVVVLSSPVGSRAREESSP